MKFQILTFMINSNCFIIFQPTCYMYEYNYLMKNYAIMNYLNRQLRNYSILKYPIK